MGRKASVVEEKEKKRKNSESARVTATSLTSTTSTAVPFFDIYPKGHLMRFAIPLEKWQRKPANKNQLGQFFDDITLATFKR
jgi:hypothetical protein